MMRCNKCNKEAQYIVEGNSVCSNHKANSEEEEGQQPQTIGEKLAGRFG